MLAFYIKITLSTEARLVVLQFKANSEKSAMAGEKEVFIVPKLFVLPPFSATSEGMYIEIVSKRYF